MKEYTYEELELYENYFFVHDGVVYYGLANKEDWEDEEKPSQFDIQRCDGSNLTICNVWNATLIYKL